MKNILSYIGLALLLFVGFSFMLMPALESITLSILFGILISLLVLVVFVHFEVINSNFSMTPEEKMRIRHITYDVSEGLALISFLIFFIMFIYSVAILAIIWLIPDAEYNDFTTYWFIALSLSATFTILGAAGMISVQVLLSEEVTLSEDSKIVERKFFLKFEGKPNQRFHTYSRDALFAKQGDRVKISYWDWDKERNEVKLESYSTLANQEVKDQNPNQVQENAEEVVLHEEARQIREDLDKRLNE